MSSSSERGVVHILLLVVLLAGLAFGVYLVQQRTNLFSKASSHPISGPVSVPYNYISWGTGYVSLTADNFYIDINQERFYVDQDSLRLTSNPTYTYPDGRKYTTLEATWQENGVEMRMYMYFDQVGSEPWKLFELRTYNGKVDGDWLYYDTQDEFGQNKIQHYFGETFVNNAGPFEFRTAFGSFNANGVVHFDNIRLKAFLDQGGPVIDLPDPLPDIPLPPIFSPQPIATPSGGPAFKINGAVECAGSGNAKFTWRDVPAAYRYFVLVQRETGGQETVYRAGRSNTFEVRLPGAGYYNDWAVKAELSTGGTVTYDMTDFYCQ